MTETNAVRLPFTESDEPLTIREMATRLNEPPRRVRECYKSLRRRLPDQSNLKPLANGRQLFLTTVAANRVAMTLAKKKRH